MDYHKKVLDEMHELYLKKNHDYGDSARKTWEKFGITATLVRLHDKYQRLETLAKGGEKIKDEPIRDTLIDLANYAVMAVAEMDRAAGLKAISDPTSKFEDQYKGMVYERILENFRRNNLLLLDGWVITNIEEADYVEPEYEKWSHCASAPTIPALRITVLSPSGNCEYTFRCLQYRAWCESVNESTVS